MKIGIDFDDTIVKTTKSVRSCMDKYNITKFSNYEEKEVFYKKHAIEILNNIEMMEDLKYVLNELDKNNNLYLITARNNYYNENVIKLVKEYIKINKLPFKELYFDCYGIDKLNKCLELGIDLFIDDDLVNIRETNDKIKTIYYNGDDDNYLCINNWKDILKEVNKWMSE